MKLYKAGLTVLFAGVLLLSAPLSTYAAEATFFGPIVPEECLCKDRVSTEGQSVSTAPDYGCALQVFQNVVNFTLTIGVILFVLYMVVTGFTFMMSGSSPETRNKAKTRFMNVFVGLVVLLCAWLVIDYVMKTLSNEDKFFGPWNAILAGDTGGNDRCIIAREPTSILSGAIDLIIGGGPPSGAGGSAGTVAGTKGCPTCVKLEGLDCKTASSCTIDGQVYPRLVQLKSAFSGSWVVTEAFPPTATHKNACHANGTCIDAGFRGDTAYNAQNIGAFANAARKAGLRVVFETPDCSLKAQAQSVNVKAYCKTDNGYEHITGTHFSVYSN